jgi:hypothetical protein
MRLDEFKNPSAKSILSIVAFKKLIRLIKSEINGGNVSAIKTKNRIMKQWNAGERLAHKYELDLNAANLSLKKLLKD